MYGGGGAFGWGYRIGDNLRELAPQAEMPEFDNEQIQQVQAEKKRIFAPMGRKKGVNPLQLEDLVRKILTNYVGIRKTGPKLKRCLEHLQTIKTSYPLLVMVRLGCGLLAVTTSLDLLLGLGFVMGLVNI